MTKRASCQTHSELLLKVWSEIGKHLQFEESMPVIARYLRPLLAMHELRIEELSREPCEIVTAYLSPQLADGRRQLRACDASLLQALERWGSQRQIAVVAAGGKPPAPLAHLREWQHEGATLVGPLHAGSRMVGLMSVLCEASAYTAEQLDLFKALLEPIGAALANDQRLREIERLGAAAEADKQSLLSRLGRSSVSENIVGAGSGLQQVMQRVEQVAPTDATVLILGETGSGKEVIARAVHERSTRRHGPFVRVNCGAVPPDLIDSELFGHEKGSFTGALAARRGWFERADGGTLFLDEIGELSPAVQIRLLRVLQDGIVQRVGSERDINVNVRVIAATHRDLPGMVQEGRFREDLWYRLAVFLIILPPLRERQDDMPELVEHFVQRAAGRLGVPIPAISKRDFERLVGYRWPGNVRELAAVLERAVILGQGRTLEVEAALGTQVSRPRSTVAAKAVEKPADDRVEKPESFDDAMAAHLKRSLRLTHGRVDGPHGAARLLGINTSTLRGKLRKLGIDPRAFRS